MKIEPITFLRNTNQLEADLKKYDEPIYITKNGSGHLVVMTMKQYESMKTGLIKENNQFIGESSFSIKKQSEPLGFVRIRAAAQNIHVGSVSGNIKEMKKAIDQAVADKVHVLVFPELSLTGYTCGDLFLNEKMQKDAALGTIEMAKYTEKLPILVVFGAPLAKENHLYNCAVVCYNGEILGVVPKTYIPNYNEFYEKRYFKTGFGNEGTIAIKNKEYPFGSNLIFVDENYDKLKIGIEICEDLWVPDAPNISLAMAGATMILNLSSSNETFGKQNYRRDLVKTTSSRDICAYAYACSGRTESTTDLVFSGHNLICEDGNVLAETELFSEENATADVDMDRLLAKRRKTGTFDHKIDKKYRWIGFDLAIEKPSDLKRQLVHYPFLPTQENEKKDLKAAKTIIDMQAVGLLKRLETVRTKSVYIGLSGGLDSTLALLVAVEAFKRAGWDLKGVHAITLPAFGTSKRTHDNAVKLADALGVDFEEINIKDSVLAHFKDTKHDPEDHDLAYENAQARMRTMVLMDIANERGGLMVGTGDLSELCLGWCTYGGDHMSMYGVNGSIPKTLVRYLVEAYAEMFPIAAEPLNDISATPISPELLPPKGGEGITQVTEDVVGPYVLNDFFIYYFLTHEFGPRKIYFLASEAFKGIYTPDVIKGWLENFFTRFFRNQFKRSCLPDGPKITAASVSPRGDWRMPSDASAEDYLAEIRSL